MHINNLHNIAPPPIRRLQKKEDYVENKLIKLFKGGTFLDEPLEENKLPEPIKPTKYKPNIPEPKPRTKKRPLPLPRIIKKRPLQHVSEKVEKIKKLIDYITPFYNPESIREFKKLLKFIPKIEITEKEKALKNNAKSFEVSIINKYEPLIQLNNTKKAIFELLKSIMDKRKGFKFSMTLKVLLSKKTEDEKIYKEPYFNGGPMTVINKESIMENIDMVIETILNTLPVWLSEGSGWVIEEVPSHSINIVSYLPLKGKSYIPLSEELCNPRKGLINLKNEDNQCFRWCHIRHLNRVKKDPQRITKKDREHVKNLDYSGVTFPVSLKDINKIEKQNSINVNVFGYEKGVFPIRISREKFKDHLHVPPPHRA